ncbi:MAG: immunoglobulin domain-containing protein, partial [Bacteroidetes bacterium]|nr:immunoglobulin domain-containing protein [Bacteroidota bacterium]
TDKAENGQFPSGQWGGANDDLAIPGTTGRPHRQRWFRFNIFSFLPINLAPVAAKQPVFAYTTPTITQTNRMRQILQIVTTKNFKTAVSLFNKWQFRLYPAYATLYKNVQSAVPRVKTRRPMPAFFAIAALLLTLNGYSQVSNYTASASTGTYAALSGAGITSTTTLTNGTADDGNVVVNLPFTFSYNGTAYTQVTASTNGWLGMGSTTSNDNNNTNMFGNGTPPNLVAGWWGNLNLNSGNSGSFKYGLTGTDIFTMQFDQFSGASGGNPSSTLKVRFQISLYGPNSSSPGRIDILFGSTTGAVTTGRVIGIKSQASTTASWINMSSGTASTSSTSGAAAFPANGTLYTFLPPVPQVSNFSGNTVCASGTGQLTVTTSSGAGPFTVVYNDGTSNQTATAVVSGTAFNANPNPSGTTNYTLVSVKDANGVTRSTGFTDNSATITVNPVITGNSLSGASSVCTGSSPGQITGALPTGGSGTYTYAWQSSTTSATTGFGTTISSAQSFTPGTLTQTTWYRRTVTSGTCTDVSLAVQITVNPLPQNAVNSFNGNTICNGGIGGTGQLTLTTSAGTGPFTIVYNDGIGNQTANGVVSGTPFNVVNNPTTSTTYTLVSITDANGCVRTTGFGDASAGITVNILPSISGQPVASQVKCSGQSASFSVTATGTPSPTYQWRKDGNPISGATAATFTIPSTAVADGGNYDVVITNSCGSVTSTVSALTVNPKPTVDAISNLTFCNGSSSTLVSFAPTTNSGNGNPVTFNWTNDNINIGLGASGVGNIQPFAATNGTQAPISGTISVTATDNITGCVSAVSTFTITVNPSPAVLNPPGNQTVCNGKPASITFTGAITSFDWSYNSSDPGDNINIAPGPGTVNGTVWNFTATNTGNVPLTAHVTVIPHFSGNSVNCNDGVPVNFDITVNPSPSASVINTTPQTICSTGFVDLSANTPVVGTGLWSVSGPSNSAGQFDDPTSPTAKFTPAGGFGIYTLTWTISNSPCNSSASSVVITVNQLVTNLAVNAALSSLCDGSGTNITVANSTPGVSYQLRNDLDNSAVGSPVLGTGGTINLPTGTLNTTTTFNVYATVSPCGSIQLDNKATVNVNPNLPVSVTISSNDADNIICSGTSVTFTANVVNGGTTPAYQWKLNGANVGTNSATFTTSTLTNGQTVTCVVTSNATCATGSPATSNGITTTVNATPQVSSFTDAAFCSGSPAPITLAFSSGTAPFQITYTAGQGPSPVTQTGVANNVAFNTTNSYTGTANITLTLTSVIDNNGCQRTTGFTDGTTILNGTLAPDVTSFSVSNSTAPCANGTSTVTVSSTTLGGNTQYAIVYSLSGSNTATNQTATFTTNNAFTKTGSFNTIALANSGTTVITITSITQVTTGCTTA